MVPTKKYQVLRTISILGGRKLNDEHGGHNSIKLREWLEVKLYGKSESFEM